jgi:hypothetical protein
MQAPLSGFATDTGRPMNYRNVTRRGLAVGLSRVRGRAGVAQAELEVALAEPAEYRVGHLAPAGVDRQ